MNKKFQYMPPPIRFLARAGGMLFIAFLTGLMFYLIREQQPEFIRFSETFTMSETHTLIMFALLTALFLASATHSVYEFFKIKKYGGSFLIIGEHSLTVPRVPNIIPIKKRTVNYEDITNIKVDNSDVDISSVNSLQARTINHYQGQTYFVSAIVCETNQKNINLINTYFKNDNEFKEVAKLLLGKIKSN